jgi:hypothetical protein
MRVQDPDKYAEILLSISQPNDGYTAQRIRTLYGKGERSINFKTPIPVYVTYQTAFVDGAGRLQRRADIYGLDKRIASLLHEDRPVADIPIARNYSTGSKPVMARPRTQARTWAFEPRRAPRHEFAYGPRGWETSNPPVWQPQAYPRFDRFRVW